MDFTHFSSNGLSSVPGSHLGHHIGFSCYVSLVSSGLCFSVFLCFSWVGGVLVRYLQNVPQVRFLTGFLFSNIWCPYISPVIFLTIASSWYYIILICYIIAYSWYYFSYINFLLKSTCIVHLFFVILFIFFYFFPIANTFFLINFILFLNFT